MISPSQGANKPPVKGSMARPSPSMRPANTGSGTSSSVTHQPSNGASISIGIDPLLRYLDPVEPPHGIQLGSRKAQAQVVLSGERRQSLGRQRHHADAGGSRGQRQSDHNGRIAAIHTHLEFALRSLGAAHPNLG